MVLPAGTWVICASVQFRSSFNQIAMLSLTNTNYVTAVVRGTGTNGGGLATSIIIQFTSSGTLYMDVNQQSTADVEMNQIQFRAVRIK